MSLAVVVRREAQSFFQVPFAWVILAVMQCLMAFQFLAQIELFLIATPQLQRLPQPPGIGEMVVAPTLGTIALLVLFVVPALTMHTLAGERRAGTLVLWLSAPLGLGTLVVGKFLGILTVLAVWWLLTGAMCLSLAGGTQLDWGGLASALLGLALLMMTTTAIGVAFSSLTHQPALAATGSFTCLVFLWLCDWSSGSNEGPSVFTQISLMNHYQRLLRGLVDTADVAYFCVLTAAALALAVWRLDGERRAL
ncbi:MAG: ABC transporter permease [Gammaproteobacteria bacterium]|nr:ABC transporter permease [Gammaproteobacteria bacterium]